MPNSTPAQDATAVTIDDVRLADVARQMDEDVK